VNFVGGETVPDDELSVLRSTDKVSRIGGPVQSVDLTEVTLEDSSLFEGAVHSLNFSLRSFSQRLFGVLWVSSQLLDFLFQFLNIVLALSCFLVARHDELQEFSSSKTTIYIYIKKSRKCVC